MELKAFNKLSSEAETAIAERRLNDAFALIEAILHDLDDATLDDINLLRSDYAALLRFTLTGNIDQQRDDVLQRLFRQTIETLQKARYHWTIQHKPTTYSKMASHILEFGEEHVIEQLQITTLHEVGEKHFHDAVDAAFSLLWCNQFTDKETSAIADELLYCNDFTLQTLVGALLMGELDYFSSSKLQLLLSMSKRIEKSFKQADFTEDTEEKKNLLTNAANLQARLAVAMTLTYLRYQPFFQFYPDLTSQLEKFFASDKLRPHLPLLLRAIVSQSLADRVGQRVDDILPIIKQALEKQEHRLGSTNEDEDKESESEDLGKKYEDVNFEIRVAKLEGKEGRRMFRKLANHAREVDEMRQNDMDINSPSFTHMKQFAFFHHPAHWFYPFSEKVPDIQKGMHLSNGKPDKMTLHIMNASRFCDSDRYSYACMMAFLRRDGKKTISDQLREQIDQMSEDFLNELGLEDEDVFNSITSDEEEERTEGLNVYFSFCQSIYRFFLAPHSENAYSDIFRLADHHLLPLLPLFKPLYNDFGQMAYTIETLIQMGANEHAIILIDHAAETFGTNAALLQKRGWAFMQMQQWNRALTAFQQSQLIEEDDDISLYIARCYEALHNWEEALPLLVQEEERQGDKPDADAIEEVARCLLQLHRWDEAVQRFFRLEFMGEHITVAQRGIGWCSLHQGKYERAEQYYRQLIDKSSHPSWEDRLNLGHALWLQHRPDQALNAYRQFVTTFNRCRKAQRAHFGHWTEAFREDAHTLLKPTFTETDIALMLDLIPLKDIKGS